MNREELKAKAKSFTIKETKKVDELETGDVVIFPGCKEISTITNIVKNSSPHRFTDRYLILTLEFNTKVKYYGDEEVTFLYKEKQMNKSKVSYKGYELEVTAKPFVLKESYDLEREEIPNGFTYYSGTCKELDFDTESCKSFWLIRDFKREVDNIITLKSKQKDKEQSIREGYYQELAKVRRKAEGLTTFELRAKLNEVYILFSKVLDLNPEDVIKDYYEKCYDEK